MYSDISAENNQLCSSLSLCRPSSNIIRFTRAFFSL